MLITGEPWVQGIFELSVLSLQFFLKSKTFLKNKVYLKICSPCTLQNFMQGYGKRISRKTYHIPP